MKQFLAAVFLISIGTSALAQEVALPPDPTGAVSADGIYKPPALATLEGEFAEARALEDDPRIADWIALQQSKDFQGLLRATEADLRGDVPHPYAAHVWAWAHWAQGTLTATQLPEMPQNLAQDLSFAGRAFAHDQLGRFDLLAEMADEALARETPNYMADIAITYAARDFGNPEAAHALSRRLVLEYPNAFGAAFYVGDEARDGASDAVLWLDRTPELNGTPAAALIRWLAAHGDIERVDLARAVGLWLDHADADSAALRRQAYQLERLNRYDEALALFEREHAVFPFRDASYRVARVQATQGAFTAALTTVQDWIALSEPEAARAGAEAAMQVKALAHTGEFGRAREIGLVALDAAPDETRLRIELGRALRSEGFAEEALDILAPALAVDPANHALAEIYVSAFSDVGRPSDAIYAIETYRAAGGHDGPAVLNDWRQALMDAGRVDEIDTVLQIAREKIPNVHWVIGNFAWTYSRTDRMEDAFALLRDLSFETVLSDWQIARLEEYGTAVGSAEEAEAVLAALALRYPYKSELWIQLQKLGGHGPEFWAGVIEKAPLESFPVIRRAKARFEQEPEAWRDILAQMDGEIARMETAGAEKGEIAHVLLERAQIADEVIWKRHSSDLSIVPMTLTLLDRARAFGISEQDYWDLRFFVLGRLGPSLERTEAALKRATLMPDVADPQNQLFQSDISQHMANPRVPFLYFSRYLERRPRDAERLNSFARYHNKYGGSPVVALALLERARRWNPDYNVEAETEFAYGKLGAEKRYYEAVYNRGYSIANSQRYVDWFDGSRAKARKEQNTIKTLDLETMRIVMRRPDGIEEERHFHPIFGRVLYYRIGAFEASMEYTADGHLAGLKTGNQRNIKLDYAAGAASHLDGKITRLVVNDDEEFRFSYDDAGNVRLIDVVGMGQVETTYDEQGEISSVNAVMNDGSDPGVALSLKITHAFSKILEDTRLANEIESGDVSGIKLDDPELDALRTAHRAAGEASFSYSREGMEPGLALAAYLIERVGDHPNHADEAQMLLEGLFYDAALWEESAVGNFEQIAAAQFVGIEAARLWRNLMLVTRPDGLPGEIWSGWSRLRDWAETREPQSAEVTGAMARLRAEIERAPLRLLSQSGWLARTDLANPGFWRNFDNREVFPSLLVGADFRMRDILVRRNGDVVVASTVGLAVLRRGHWEWFAFDTAQRRFSGSVDYASLEGASNLSSLAEDDQGRLWLGGRSGLMMLPEDYDGDVMIWRGGANGMFGGAVNDLEAAGNLLAIAGDEGLSLVSLGDLGFSHVSKEPVNRLRSTPDGILVIGRNALWLQQDEQRTDIIASQVTDAILGPWDETLYVLTGHRLQSTPWEDVLRGAPALRGVEGHEAIAATAPPAGLAVLGLDDRNRALTVLYDKGGAVLWNGDFESFSKPDSLRPVGLVNVDERDGRLFMITSEGVSAVVRGQAHYDIGSRVYDLLSDPELEVTFVATGYGIDAVDHRDPSARATYFSGADARILRMAPDGALIAHDRQTVLRFAPGSHDAQELFDATQTLTDGGRQGQISDILAAKDGSIWAVAGASVFRWQAGVPLEEYSIYQEAYSFPVFSDMLYAIHETSDGRILLVASNEGHRNYKAQPLFGGLFEYTGTGFAPSPLDVLGSWFMSSHTQIDDETAIVGTASGFARLRAGRLDEFDQIDDPSYMALRGLQPALYLGTKGARLGEDLWLFGSAGGVVAYKGGQWFYPDRLNWILPGLDYANYGARAVHAVATDAQGKVYIGTDWGLTVYDPGGAGAESFLISESRGDFAFSVFERERMTEVNDILLDALPEESASGKLAATFRQNRQRLAELEQQLSQAQVQGSDLANLEKDLRRTQQRDLAILAKLEQEEPLLFNMLQLNPLDLRALGRKLPDDVVIVQYLPADKVLYINVVSQNGAELKQVEVSRTELDGAVALVTAHLAAQARGQTRGFDVSVPTLPDTAQDASLSPALPEEATAPTHATAEAALGWLYDTLLRPVEHSIGTDATLVVSPAGALSYLPFAALIREQRNGKPVYAVQHFDMATAPSLYALDLMIDAPPSTAFSHLVIGDPDGTLPQARAEAEAIADILADDLVELRIGEEATYDELLSYASDARFVHLAMHGKLDHLSPRDSYLLLAGNRRMSIPQIMTLPMASAELVFLSACETGLGRDGLEFRTIAHAFAHAGAPAIIATLWQVEDDATRKLAEAFYSAKVDGASNATALGHAQRNLIESGGPHAQPGYWAAALVMGKP